MAHAILQAVSTRPESSDHHARYSAYDVCSKLHRLPSERICGKLAEDAKALTANARVARRRGAYFNKG